MRAAGGFALLTSISGADLDQRADLNQQRRENPIHLSVASWHSPVEATRTSAPGNAPECPGKMMWEVTTIRNFARVGGRGKITYSGIDP